jgi:nitrogen fixation protein FixH
MSRLAAWLLRGDRWIPSLFFAFFGLVLIANGSMIVVAFQTWPGLETTNAYQRGLAYNKALAAAAEQAELGWKVGFTFAQEGARRAVVRVDLEDRFGNLLQDAEVRARFVRPTQEGHDLTIDLPHQTGGRYLAEVELPLDGQWDVRIDATSRGQTWRLSERIFVRP